MSGGSGLHLVAAFIVSLTIVWTITFGIGYFGNRPACLRPLWRRRFRYSAALMISSATSFGKDSIAT
jgi:hypothetical protein